MKTRLIAIVALLLIGAVPSYGAPITIAASLPDLASIASNIGGGEVRTFSVAKAGTNPHYVEVLPSYMIMVSRAAVYLKVGLALDQWADDIIAGSRNGRLLVVDCSRGITVLQKPLGRVDASMGDVHPEGNPHYWLDPSNGIIIAETILEALAKADPAHRAYYEENYRRFRAKTEERVALWQERMSKLEGRRMLTYHSSWVYFAAAFGLTVAANVEPLPGIPPSGRHLAGLVETIKRDRIEILIQEPYFPDAAGAFLSRETGIRILRFSPSCDDAGPDSYVKHFEEIVSRITEEGRP